MAENAPNILLCTLGGSWAVIPESYALLAPDRLPLYRHHPRRAALERLRREHRLAAPDELWVCSTDGTDTTDKSLQALQSWWALLGEPGPLRIWLAGGSAELAESEQVARMRELILRVTLRASEGQGQLVLSLAGGRKTMSADLQYAGQTFGCRALMHVIGPNQLPDALKKPTPEQFARPLPGDLVDCIMPVVLEGSQRSELLDVALNEGISTVRAAQFPVPSAGKRPERVAAGQLQGWLDAELQRRRRAGASLFGNYLRALDEPAPYGNWRSLYRLPPPLVESLKNTPLDDASRGWLLGLPKAELHCHLGGLLALPAQRRVARALWEALPASIRDLAWRQVGPWLGEGNWPDDWSERLRESETGLRSACAALLLCECEVDELEARLFTATEPRVGLKKRLGFAAYERPGELSGSALLQQEAAIEPYARAVVEAARAQNLRYLELRGSPQKYLGGNGRRFLRLFHRAIGTYTADEELLCRFVVIVDRRRPEMAAEVIRMAVDLREELDQFVAGLDLAGAEDSTDLGTLAQAFEPAFERCLPVTIHAGEGAPAENIWQAAYRLHADRIGHGLTLAENPPLLRRFRDRGICIELCPTSNREVVGFYDPRVPATAQYPVYPLADLLAEGLRVTLCTDNPGISRTTLSDEYLTATRMIAGQRTLSRWDALLLIRQAFRSAFLPADQRSRLMKAVDHALFEQLLDEYGHGGLG